MNDNQLVISLLEFSHDTYFALEWFENKWYLTFSVQKEKSKGFDKLEDCISDAVIRFNQMAFI